MSAKADELYQLLPAVYRLRDADQGKPLYALLSVIADQVAVLEENLAQLHDDQFVETAAPWVLPYIGDLIGLEGVNGTGLAALRPRAEVANTIGYRRRKGTAAMLEQLARDVTGWPARAVEFFQLLATTQYMNHLRPENASMLDIRDGDRLEFLDSAFERIPSHLVPADCSTPTAIRAASEDLPHNVDVRRISSGRGKYNIPNVGIFLWRLKAQRLSQSPAVPAATGDKRRFRFSPLGVDQPLFSLPVTEDDFTHLADPINVPMRLSRRMLKDALADYYGPGRSILIEERIGAVTTPIDINKVCVCDLSGWAHTPTGTAEVAIDPVLGRMSFAADRGTILVTYHHGFSADMGGGEYERDLPYLTPSTVVTPVVTPGTISAALVGLAPGANVIEVQDSGRYVECPALAPVGIPNEGGTLTLRAADKRAPLLVLNDAMGPRDLTLTGDALDEIVLDGLTIVGGTLRVPNNGTNALGRLTLRHCTLVPGLGIPDAANEGFLAMAADPSLVVELDGTRVTIDSCIVGAMRVSHGAQVSIANSMVDATDQSKIAFCAASSEGPGAQVNIVNSTIVGRVNTAEIALASDSIFVATLPAVYDPVVWTGPVRAERRQEGCMRFSHAPWGSRLPRQYKCQPTSVSDASRVYPAFDSLSYGHPTYGPEYGRLSLRAVDEIRRGADDESEMGVFHDLLAPLRENLVITRLNEYLRFGLEVGVFYAS
jgi:hypothetical protein